MDNLIVKICIKSNRTKYRFEDKRDGNGQVDIDSANSWISLLDSYGISYVCWNLSNKDEKSALLTPACDKTSGFTYEDLSDEGKWLYGVLTSHVTQESSGI